MIRHHLECLGITSCQLRFKTSYDEKVTTSVLPDLDVVTDTVFFDLFKATFE